ncbi:MULTISPECIES: glycine zipper 2TM domain-containing protein [Sphingomonadaceae]|uniref:glycine zipper 2TM domain-containing protein n=1 Tax=Sphingomonadaceae TaxID=41297 RepID=UPI0011581FE7|nr:MULTISPECIES: glycine zipper 2TM domain-containing protein [Sphingomonadaceae]QDK33446.1 hypothetical protein DM450_11840 [Sphingomonas sp. IC081]QSR17853.1 hypothetical protein CA833_11735 [Novosphingobium sp. KA1]
MKKTLLALTMAAVAIPLATPVAADPPRHAPAHGYRDKHKYDSRGRYAEPRRMSRNDHVWRGHDGRYYCKRDNGTTGLIIGAGAGALAGHEIAGNGDQTLGAIIGGVAGGLLGREIDRGEVKCR